MTRVDFYVLETGTHDALFRFICRLTEKAWRQGNRIFMHCDDQATASKLDDLLWNFRDVSFLPHGFLVDEPEAPIAIGVTNEPTTSFDLMINLAKSVPEFFSRFERVVETAGVNDQEKSLARERYRFYQKRGYALETHKIQGA